MKGFLRRVFGGGLPAGFGAELDRGEYVLATAVVKSGGHLVATSHGLWVPGPRRIGWHLVSKATWGGGALTVVEAREAERAGDAVLLADLEPVRFVLLDRGRLPEIVHTRVTKSITSRHRQELPGGGAWFVQRRVPGQDGIVLQVRPDRDADPAAVRAVAEQVAAKVREARGQAQS